VQPEAVQGRAAQMARMAVRATRYVLAAWIAERLLRPPLPRNPRAKQSAAAGMLSSDDSLLRKRPKKAYLPGPVLFPPLVIIAGKVLRESDVAHAIQMSPHASSACWQRRSLGVRREFSLCPAR
jgi:hypothetical protein